MDKRKLIAQTAKKSGYAKWEVNKIVDSLLENIFETLQQGESGLVKHIRHKLAINTLSEHVSKARVYR